MTKPEKNISGTSKFIKGSLIATIITAVSMTYAFDASIVEAASDSKIEDGNKANYSAFVTSTFSDVKTDHYSYAAINWAQSRGIVSGYGNGKFGPNDSVTEAQFSKMVGEYFNLKGNGNQLVKKTIKEIWSDSYYNRLAAHGVPFNGYFDNAIRNSTVKRGTVAQALAYLGGYSMDLEDSINFLLDNNVTIGQNPEHKNDVFKYFGSQNDLSRAQIVTFLYRMNNNNLSKVGVSANSAFNNDNEYTLNQSAIVGMNSLDKSLSKDDAPAVSGDSYFNKPGVKPGVVKPEVKPNYSMPVSSKAQLKNLDSKVIDYFNKTLSNSVKNKIFGKGYEVLSSENSSKNMVKAISFYNSKSNQRIGYTVGKKEDNISFKVDDEDIAIAILNQTYGYKFTKGSLAKADIGKIGKNIIIFKSGENLSVILVTILK